MEFRKMVMITLYARQKKRHRCIEQTFGFYGRRRGWMSWENSIETCILSSVKQITSPGWMHETSAQGWCTGMTQRDGTGREVGEGIGMGAHINPWLIHVNVWQKPLRYCKVISLQLIKTNEKKKEITGNCFCVCHEGKYHSEQIVFKYLWSKNGKMSLCNWNIVA